MQIKMQNKKRKENSMSELKIGNVTLENNLILAPMAGVTDLPFRLLCRRQGAGLLCMDLIQKAAKIPDVPPDEFPSVILCFYFYNKSLLR